MLQVLVSTTKTQGNKEGDFCFVPEDELVMFGLGIGSCDEEEFLNSDSNCNIAMIGYLCRKGTTTVKVSEIKISKKEYVELLWKSEKKHGVSTKTIKMIL